MSSLYMASNNGSTTLATASINSTATSFTVASGHGDRFPSPSGGDYFLVTFENGSTREIMCIVGRSTDTMTVGIPGSASANVAGRNYESIYGMTAATWTSGAIISCRATAAVGVAGMNSQANIPTTIHAATAKTPVVDADELPLVDSAASWVIKKFTLATLWTWIQTHLASPGAIGGTTPAAVTGTAITGTTATFTSTVTIPTALTGVVRADAGVLSVDTDVTDIVSAASDTLAGKVELATSAETITGTDTARAVTPAGGAAAFAALAGNASQAFSATTAAVGTNTTQVATTAFCEAGFVNNDVGNDAIGSFILAEQESGGSIDAGSTVAGSSLYPGYLYSSDISSIAMSWTKGTARTGTWRNISGVLLGNSPSNAATVGIWQRIS